MLSTSHNNHPCLTLCTGGHGEAAGVQGRGQAVPRLRLGGRPRPRRVSGAHPWTGHTSTRVKLIYYPKAHFNRTSFSFTASLLRHLTSNFVLIFYKTVFFTFLNLGLIFL